MPRNKCKKSPLSSSQRMSRIKSKNTTIEKKLAKAMWEAGLHYRKNVRTVYGTPDFIFKSKKIAIFCDSEFWHGKKFLEGEIFKKNSDFWETKIKRNIQRDIEVTEKLRADGWTVIRFWGKEIENNLSDCILKVISAYNVS
ncbi:MAG: very short patch repair endonuclease [Sulfuricurvum sp.]|nr:very short patch repair endonuclease [Sulfuricurvum sp.]